LQRATVELHELETELQREADQAQRAEQALAEARADTAMKAEELAALRATAAARVMRERATEPIAENDSGQLGMPPATAAEHPRGSPVDDNRARDDEQLEMDEGWQIVAPPTRRWARIATPPVDPVGNSVFLKVLQYNVRPC
jgi:hypothetical protein